MKRIAMVGAVALALGACAGEDERAYEPPEELQAYTVTGETENCITVTRIRESRPLDDFHILFFVTGKDVYLSKMKHRCAGLGREKSFMYSTGLTKLCSLDTITVLNSPDAMPLGSCGLGEFQKLEKIPEATAPVEEVAS